MSSPEKPAPKDNSAAFSTAVTLDVDGLGAVDVVLASAEDILLSLRLLVLSCGCGYLTWWEQFIT